MKRLLAFLCLISLFCYGCNCLDLAPSKCVHVANPIVDYTAQVIRYAASLIQCAVYCQHYQAANSFFAYRDNTCVLYQNYPRYTNVLLSMNCIKFSEELQRRYCLVTRPRNFTEAFNFCRNNYMNLLSIESEEENSFLFDWLYRLYCATNVNCGVIVWTSGFYSKEHQEWAWQTTNNTFTVAKWFSTRGTHLALYVRASHSKNAYWLASYPNQAVHFICEMEA